MSRQMQRGFSVLEALVMLAVTAVTIWLLVDLLGRSAMLDFRRAESGLAQARRGAGEDAFRALVRAAGPAPESGGSRIVASGAEGRLDLDVFSTAPALCVAGTGWARVSLSIEQDGENGLLRCRSGAREDVLAHWSRGRGAFAYQSGDAGWRPVAYGDQEAPTRIRFATQDVASGAVMWVEALSPPIETPVLEMRETDGGGNLDR